MKATVDRRALVAALKIVAPAVAKGGHMPVLEGVRIDCAKAGFDLTCSNLELTISTMVDAPHGDKGTVVVPAALLTRIVGAMDGETVELFDDANKLIVSSGETVATIRTFPVADWPQLPEPDTDPVTLDGETVSLVSRIIGMASVDRSRPIIGAVHFGNGRAAATDSYRLGVVDGIPDELGPALVPADALRSILSGGGTVDVSIDDSHARFCSGRVTTIARLGAGDYPNYGGLLPSSTPYSLTFGREALAASIDRLRSLDVEAQRGITIARDGDKARLSCTDDDLGSVVDVISCSGDFDQTIGFNPVFLGELVDALEGDDEVSLGLIDDSALKPVVARSGRLTLLVMPVKVK